MALFPIDNNGTILQLPSVNGGAASVIGSLTLGIGTQSNNGLGNAHVIPTNSYGFFTTTYKGVAQPKAFWIVAQQHFSLTTVQSLSIALAV